MFGNKQKTWKIPWVENVWLCHMKWAPIHNSTALFLFFRHFLIYHYIFSCIRLKLEAFLYRFFANFCSTPRMHFTHDNQFKLNTDFFLNLNEKQPLVPFLFHLWTPKWTSWIMILNSGWIISNGSNERKKCYATR